MEESNSGAKEKGQAQLIALFLILALVPTTLIVAQNVTNSTSVDGFVTDVNLTEGVTDEEILNETDTEVPEGSPETAEENVTEEEPEENVTVEIPETNITEPEDNATIPEENVTIPEENETTFNERNVTLPEENITIPEENVTIPEDNQTIINETNVTLPEENATVPEEAALTIELTVPERSTRGDGFTITATVENKGTEAAENVALEWILPEYIEVFAGNENEEIGLLDPGASFTSELTVFSTIEAGLGPNEIKVRVSYE